MTYLILIKKEAVEAFRTYRFFIISILFLLFGLAAPATAKLLPEIIKNLGTGESLMIQVPMPTVYDSWLQFFSNHSQMTLIIFMITFGQSLGKELSDGTMVLLVTKGINRNTAMLAKFSYQAGLWLAGLAGSALITYLYNFVLFSGENQPVGTILWYVFSLWLFGVFFIGVSQLGQVLLPKASGGLLLSFLAIAGLLILNIFSAIEKVSPLNLIGVTSEGLKNGIDISNSLLPLLITLGLVILAVCCAGLRFKKVPVY
ncbi:ABC transporter permease [Enterococcus sp. LJL128]